MGMSYSAPGRMVAHSMVTTQFELDGFRVTRTLGVVRGIVVRSRSIFGTIGASLQTILGGNITLLTNLCEKTRAEAFDLMLQHAAELGGNAVVGARYDATEIMQGVTEVLAYGTAVFVEPMDRRARLPSANRSFSSIFCRYWKVCFSPGAMKSFCARSPNGPKPGSYSIKSRTIVPFAPFRDSTENSCRCWNRLNGPFF